MRLAAARQRAKDSNKHAGAPHEQLAQAELQVRNLAEATGQRGPQFGLEPPMTALRSGCSRSAARKRLQSLLSSS
jgi:hypothetical protein